MVLSVVPLDGPVGGPVSGPVGCPVIDLVGEPVGDLVGGLVGGPVRGLVDGPVWSVVWSVVRFVGWLMVQSVVRSVQSVVQAKHVLFHTPYNGQPASDARTSVAQGADSGFCTVCVLRWCCVLWKLQVSGPSRSGRWSGRWYAPVVAGLVGGPVSGLVGGPVCGLVNGPVCGLVRAVCGPSKHVLLQTMACQLQMLAYWSQGACDLL